MHIKEFVKLYWKHLYALVDTTQLDNTHTNFYIFQKPDPEQGIIDKKDKDGHSLFKDGFHVLCKDIQTIPELQLFVRDNVLKEMDSVLPKETFCLKNS